MQKIILASNSSYRHELLSKIGLNFESIGSNVDETPYPGETAQRLTIRLSIAKAQALAPQYPNHLIIGSDQVATCNGQFLGKPGNFEQAKLQLETQSGQAVLFYTGLCVFNSSNDHYLTDLDCCTVHFRNLTTQQIERYLTVDRPYECAGSFKSEGYGITLIQKISASDPNALIGLPLIKLISLLTQFGLTIP